MPLLYHQRKRKRKIEKEIIAANTEILYDRVAMVWSRPPAMLNQFVSAPTCLGEE